MSTFQPHLKYHLNKILRRTSRAISSRLFVDSDQNPRKSIIISGTGRSGTTWLASLISSRIACRIMFEPFHTGKIPQFSRYHLFQYMRPYQQDNELYKYACDVLSGNIRHPWIDWQNEHLFPKYRLVKEIRANLFLKWLHNKFPETPLLFILRHPCAVVLSRMEMKWATTSDIQPFLNQEELILDHIEDKLDIINKASTTEEKHAIIWCVSNYVPLRQFEQNELNVFFYEALCTQPEVELPRLFEVVGLEFKPSFLKLVNRPSATAGVTSAVMTGEDKTSRWKRELTSTQIDKILRIVQEFGMDQFYTDSPMPEVSALSKPVLGN